MKKQDNRERRLSVLRDIFEIFVSIAVFGLMLWAFLHMLLSAAEGIRDGYGGDRAEADTVDDDAGVGRATVCLDGVLLFGEETYAGKEKTALRVFTEGVDSPLPPWWDPESAELVWPDHIGEANKMVDDHIRDVTKLVETDRAVDESVDGLVESVDNAVDGVDDPINAPQSDFVDCSVDYNAHPPVGIDPGGIDWNIESPITGWGGRMMTVWELDLFARIFYLEFWQPNLMLCEAGCDAMLGLWDLEGGTMFETLSRINEDGSYSFSTYPGVWEAEYDPDGLAWCREYCEERFYEGPSWPAQYFRKGQYHDWGEWSPIPAYEIEGIYFSIGR